MFLGKGFGISTSTEWEVPRQPYNECSYVLGGGGGGGGGLMSREAQHMFQLLQYGDTH